MYKMDFIGRAEREVKTILNSLLNPIEIKQQVPLSDLISVEEFNSLNEEVQKHKFDMVVELPTTKKIIVEVNYKHGEKAAKKWRTIFAPMLQREGHLLLTINDYECISLFKPQDYSKHLITENDYTDVRNALKLAKISIFP